MLLVKSTSICRGKCAVWETDGWFDFAGWVCIHSFIVSCPKRSFKTAFWPSGSLSITILWTPFSSTRIGIRAAVFKYWNHPAHAVDLIKVNLDRQQLLILAGLDNRLPPGVNDH